MALGLLALAMYISLCIIFRVGYAKISQRKGRFQWNMGFIDIQCIMNVYRVRIYYYDVTDNMHAGCLPIFEDQFKTFFKTF